ncbi:hypothetical protein ACIGJO_25040 [Streptomyces sp. NPDC079020]|uniref:hypothetical protein n=1 Tax=Streptomyces sp. NPDC079020 TaxID=3365722 RepID=UPI0037D30080
MTTAQSQPSASRKGLEITTVFFAATTAALSAGIIATVFHAPAFVAISAGGMSFVAAFTLGMKVFEHLSHS